MVAVTSSTCLSIEATELVGPLYAVNNCGDLFYVLVN